MSGTGSDNGWLEAAVAWEVCASLHRQYCKGKDALFTTRQSDFVKHAENARGRASQQPAPALAENGHLTQAGHDLLMEASLAGATLVSKGRLVGDTAQAADSVPVLPDFDTVEEHIYGACRRYITRDMLEPILHLIRDAIYTDRAARAPADSVQEDAARWQWLADYLIGERTDLDEGIVACTTVDALRQFADAARKQGANHDNP